MAAKKSSQDKSFKKTPSRFSAIFFFKLVLCGFALLGGFLLYTNQKEYLHALVQQPQTPQVITCFEAAFSPEYVQEKLGKSFLKNERYSWGDSQFLYAPHLLVDVKYSPESKATQSAKMLWDLTTGELVVDTQTFELTSGFQDCLSSNANTEDFRILNILAKHNGAASKDNLIKELGYDEDLAAKRIDSLRKKQLVTCSQDMVRIHVENPLFKVTPKSTITLPLVTKKIVRGQLVPPTYSQKNLLDMVAIAFGPDLAIRSSKLIYVPLIQLDITNPDSSIRTTHWNAITGRQVGF